MIYAENCRCISILAPKRHRAILRNLPLERQVKFAQIQLTILTQYTDAMFLPLTILPTLPKKTWGKRKKAIPQSTQTSLLFLGQQEIAYIKRARRRRTLYTARVSQLLRDKPAGGGSRTAEHQVLGKQSEGCLQSRILFPCTEMVPGGRYFRICVASASADTASFPLPHGRGGGGLPTAKEPGIRAARVWDEAGGLRTRNILSGKPTPPCPVRSLHQRAFGSNCVPFPSSPPHLQQTPAPPVPSEPCVRTTRAGHLPPPTASHPSPEEKARLLARTHSSVGSRQEQCLSLQLHLRHRSSFTGRLPRAAARDWNVPFRPPDRPPFPAPIHTSNQQRRRVRRAEVSGKVAEDRLQQILVARRPLPPPTNLRPRKRRATNWFPSQPPLPGRQALRRTTRNTDVPPPLPPPPLIVLPLPKGLGDPPARLQPITHLLRELDPTFSRLSAEHAQNAAALTYSRARKAGEPEPA